MKFIKLGTVCKLRNGYAFKSANFSEDGVPIIRISNINGNIVTPEKSVRTTYENIFENYKIIKGDILIAMSGATTGKFGIYNSEEVAYQNQRVGCFKVLDATKINQTYLLHVLNIIKPIIEKTANGGAQPNISANAIEEITIPLPSLKEQIRIAQILTEAENLITQRKESIDLLDEFLKSTFLEMFGDPVKNEKEWNIKTIEQFVPKNKTSIKRGPFGGALKKEIFVEDGYLVYEQFHALNNDFSMARYFIDEEKFNELKGFEVKSKDIIISCSGVYLGKLAIVPENAKKGIINQALLKITLDEKIIRNQFFVFHFSHKNFKEKYFDSNRGAGIPNFPPMSDFKKFNFIVPPIKLQDKFVTIVEKVERLKTEYQSSLKELENMFGVLSQKAFKGELSKIEETEDDKKKSNVNMDEQPKEEINIEKYLNDLEALKTNSEKRDITNMSFLEYLKIPYELIKDNEKWEFDFIGLDEFYQFLLLEVFKEKAFTFEDIIDLYSDYFYFKGDMDFDNEKWKSIIFKFMEVNPPLIEQFFDEETATIKLKLTDEAYKA